MDEKSGETGPVAPSDPDAVGAVDGGGGGGGGGGRWLGDPGDVVGSTSGPRGPRLGPPEVVDALDRRDGSALRVESAAPPSVHTQAEARAVRIGRSEP